MRLDSVFDLLCFCGSFSLVLSSHTHTAATSPVGSPGSAAVTVEGAPSESSTEVVGTPAEEQMSRYAGYQRLSRV